MNPQSLRIDWFDGTVTEERRPQASAQDFSEEDEEAPKQTTSKPVYERKLMGFKTIFSLSLQSESYLVMELLTRRSSFWDLLDTDLKPDWIVWSVKILSKLYSEFKDSRKSSNLSDRLNNNLLKTKFIDTLSNYLSNLPRVRISEKKINMHFWDDCETFYMNILLICDGICELNPPDCDKIIVQLLNTVRNSVLGVMDEHLERFSDDLFAKLDELEVKLSKIVSLKQDSEETINPKERDISQDPNNFRNLSIFPTKADLIGCRPIDIRPNIINGAYVSVEHYLDIQFRLLREDCFGPLSEGITKYLENPSKRRHENIRVHPKVRIIRTYVNNNKIGYLVDLTWTERQNKSSVDVRRLASSKQLMFGSLLLFTNDNFESILCGTVLDSSLKLLSEGYMAVSFETAVSKTIYSEAYLMVESEVFFEPYHRVMKVLKGCRNDIPMQSYIVDVKPETKPPIYLTQETQYITQSSTNQELSFPVLQSEQWPSNDVFGLDQSQMEAFQLALTREFAVIQGPPGTGKTFIGIKVATTILQNLSLKGTPMLIVCYTNHALDQFLEGILNTTNNIIRLGGQSKSKKIEPYTLINFRTHSKLYSSKRFEQENIFKQMLELQTDIEKCDKEILTYKCLKNHLKMNDIPIELTSNTEDPIMSWLFIHLNNYGDDFDTEQKDIEDWESQFDDNNSLKTCFSEDWAVKEMESLRQSIKYLTQVTDDEFERQKITDRFEDQIKKIRRRKNYFKQMLSSNTPTFANPKQFTSKDPYKLLPEERWRVYFSAVKCIKEKLIEDMSELQLKHESCSTELSNIATLVDSEVVKNARVVGVTTSTAARRHDLLMNIRSPIVIIEEAAEILEAHIIASLTHHCQHVILIGDHKQLRPTASHHKLAKDFNFDISLFERLIRNGIHARTLTIQRRMRSEFVQLIVPIVYEKLDSHTSVEMYGNVRGICGNLYFLKHEVLEDGASEDSWSHRNTYEAKWCVALASYLRDLKYTVNDITILTTYAGQATLIKELSKNYPRLRDMKITSVDNYQGEESRIVILSLVRSNKDGKIGFLNAQNRICVALSRAKEGFYIFGNMNLLSSASKIWKSIEERLSSLDAIGNCLKVKCEKHNEILEIHTSDELEKCLRGSCLKTCNK